MSDNKTFQVLERFTCHGFYTITITGKSQEQLGILPISVNILVLRIVIILRIVESVVRIPVFYDSSDKWKPGSNRMIEL